jgi:hypothetical protein
MYPTVPTLDLCRVVAFQERTLVEDSGRRRKLSATALGNIRAAQRARWAKWRKAQKG